ncbi:hypothetical protein ADIWIN_0663 [Winogradskyella psychrotolerans RS-3]|uniref:Uncharacterized protein n=2 Tax=Winogradskyella TaxID=286104 RepID=S7VW37_9FLAO|nr:hypothetical protein ADIWIN_0663 [Winogradskyella psychrotolerans RS-3]
MVGLHALTHDEDKEQDLHCEVCDYATINNVTPILTPETQEFYIENTELVIVRDNFNAYSFVTPKTITSSQLLSRPPPFLL